MAVAGRIRSSCGMGRTEKTDEDRLKLELWLPRAILTLSRLKNDAVFGLPRYWRAFVRQNSLGCDFPNIGRPGVCGDARADRVIWNSSPNEVLPSHGFCFCAPNGLRYPLVGGTRERHFDGTNLKPHKMPKNAQTPTSRVHAVLASYWQGKLLGRAPQPPKNPKL